ncbi:MAG: cytochrome ubiquinol oxidase subunit I [Puniceicoccales bacterium]|jgi:cytochrome d ubiquinol oxidase subunit I|nr:cytochrome ubiquinol oxidase subunit I [Puniceicoccales bacterium]
MTDFVLLDWSRAQFALTAIYHWLFVPLTLGLGVIMSIMETLYVKTNDPKWRRTTRFWMKIFGINFAIGVATGIILEFEFGTNWSNYSWFVGDIFGAPLAIEGIFAFFMEATFIAVMFFGWDKVSKRFHLASTWLTTAGATLSALWILVANAWMQHPVGMEFNPSTVRNEMVDFFSIVFSPVAVNKFLHTVFSSWMLAAAVVTGISSWYLLKKRETTFALDSIKIAAIMGLAGLALTLFTGDKSAFHVASSQPMKLAAMESLYNGQKSAGLTAIGIVNYEKKHNDNSPPMSWEITIPKILSLLASHDLDGFVPGICDIINGGYQTKDGVELSVSEKIRRGKLALAALADYRKAAGANDTAAMQESRTRLDTHFKYFGYGYFNTPDEVVPNVPLIFYSFRIMVILGLYFIGFFIVTLVCIFKKNFHEKRGMHWIAIFSVPAAYIASQAGWIVAEVGRQPWAIQDILPVNAAVSAIPSSSVKITFFIFLTLFSVLLLAELRILSKQIQLGPEPEETGAEK